MPLRRKGTDFVEEAEVKTEENDLRKFCTKKKNRKIKKMMLLAETSRFRARKGRKRSRGERKRWTNRRRKMMMMMINVLPSKKTSSFAAPVNAVLG